MGTKAKEAVRQFQVAKHIEVRKSTGMTLDSDEGELEPQTLTALFGDDARSVKVERVPNPHGAPQSVWDEGCR